MSEQPDPERDKLLHWKANPVAFVREEFGIEPDEWQADVLMAFTQRQRLAMKAAKGVGKSAVLAWLIWNFLATRLYPKVACVSISGANLQDGLWSELALWRGKSEFLTSAFEWQKTRIYAKDHESTWWASARQWSQTADTTSQANTLAGLHADNLLFVLDEAGGIPDAVMAAAEAGLASGVDCKLVMAGNPTNLSGPLYRATTRERHLWHLTEITADPDDPKRSSRVSVQWAREQIAKYGIDNPWVLVNVFGKFPPASFNTLIGPDDCAAAVRRQCPPAAYEHEARVLGVDVARFGDDRTVITPRQGLFCSKPIILRSARTEEICGQIARIATQWNPDAIFVDGSGGYGAGVVDTMLRAGYNVIEVNGAGVPDDPRYYNKRAEMYFNACKWVKERGTIPDIPELVSELCAPTYWLHNNKMQIEEKEQIKKRLGFSPDVSDSFVYTFAMQVLPRQSATNPLTRQSSALHEYNPMSAFLTERRR